MLVETVRERGGGWFVDDAQDTESRDASCVARRLSLRIVEISRHRDDRLRRIPCPASHLLQDHRRQFFWRVLTPSDLDVQHLASRLDLTLDDLVRNERQLLLQVGERAPHETLDAEDGVIGIA